MDDFKTPKEAIIFPAIKNHVPSKMTYVVHSYIFSSFYFSDISLLFLKSFIYLFIFIFKV